jgi:DNA-directed RNA polymerase subunit RPC12/RpoP
MNKPSGFRCESCGSANIRRSRGQSVLEFAQMALGTYPFRCLACNYRFPVNIWLWSKLKYAKCPKCLSFDLTIWPKKRYVVSAWGALLMTFGAHRYRCSVCRYHFLSFRPTREYRLEASAQPKGKSVAAGAEWSNGNT